MRTKTNNIATTMSLALLFLIAGRANAQFDGFAPYETYGVGASPYNVTTGDFNGDGILDLATANFASNSVSVLLGNADGTFQPQSVIPVGANPSFVATGDFNGSGYDDLVVVHQGDNSLRVYLGDGSGQFALAQTLTLSFNPEVITVGDWNWDANGWLDLAVGGSQSIRILLGNGDGTFTFGQALSAPGLVYSITAADLNNSGDLDLAAVTIGDTVWTFENLVGQFHHDPWQGGYTVAPMAVGIQAGDTNGNGLNDLVVSSIGGSISVLLADGSGSYQSSVEYPAGSALRRLALVDVNGNGVLDVVVCNRSAGSVAVLRGNGDGSFQSPQFFDVGAAPESIVAGDFNGHGVPDFAVTNNTSSSISVLMNLSPPLPGACCVNGAVVPLSLPHCMDVFGEFYGVGVDPADVTCEAYCPADLNGDRVVNVTDLLALFNAWGSCP